MQTINSEDVSCSVVSDSVTPWSVCSPPVSSVHGILQAKFWSGLPFLSPGNIPFPGLGPESLDLQADYLLLSHQESLTTQ